LPTAVSLASPFAKATEDKSEAALHGPFALADGVRGVDGVISD
jgi:hypothetical protein